MQRYAAAFAQLDTDRDGFVKGADCFGFFLQWQLPKTVLRDVWSVVAGNAGQLNQQQLAACLYLMDNAKRGLPVPAALPPGPFPPQQGAAPAPAPAPAPQAAPPPRAAPAPPAPHAAPQVRRCCFFLCTGSCMHVCSCHYAALSLHGRWAALVGHGRTV